MEASNTMYSKLVNFYVKITLIFRYSFFTVSFLHIIYNVNFMLQFYSPGEKNITESSKIFSNFRLERENDNGLLNVVNTPPFALRYAISLPASFRKYVCCGKPGVSSLSPLYFTLCFTYYLRRYI